MAGLSYALLLVAALACCSCAAAKKQKCTGLMALKRAETGSTWFAELLQTTKAYEVEKEIYTRAHADISISHKESKLLSVLQCKHFDGKHPVHGFTINPNNNPGINWGQIVRVAQPHVVTWRRSNVVKTTISAYRKSTEHVCGHVNNIRHDDNCTHKTMNLPFPTLMDKMLIQVQAYAKLDYGSDEATRYANGLNMSLYYEAMQQNEDRELKKLATFLGDPSYSETRKRPVSVIKKTSDDLRDVITNFDEVAKGLEDLHVPASLNCPLVSMFKETGFKVFEGCNHTGLSAFLDSFRTVK